MNRTILVFILIICVALVCLTDAKKNGKSKSIKAQKKVKENVTENPKEEDEKEEEDEEAESDMMKNGFKETSLPGAAVVQNSLPAATKVSDAGHVKSSEESGEASGDDEDDEVSGNDATDAKEDENANKPSKVKSKIKVEKDKNKIAETVKKSKVAKIGDNKIKAQAKQNANNDDKANMKNKENSLKKTEKGDKSTESDKKSKNAKQKSHDKKSKKPSKPSHHHHHHHHHHKQAEKKNKKPLVQNDANKPKKDFPTFNWTKDGKKIQKVAQIPGWGSNGAQIAANGAQIAANGAQIAVNGAQIAAPMYVAQPNMVPMNMAQSNAMVQMGAGAVKKDSVPVQIQNDLVNGTIRNQADIASIEQASIAPVSAPAQRDQQATAAKKPAEQTSSNNGTATIDSVTTDSTKDPVAAAVASDTGEVPSNITKKAELKIPNNIPSRCTNLVKAYTNAELTLHDYLKQLRKCKKADSDFNSMHVGNVMLRDAISKNGPYLTKEAYKYALERVRDYVPSSKEKQAADMILAKWRSNSFGSRSKISATGDVPDAIKSFMTGQTSEKEKAAENANKIEEQTQKAIDTAKSYILGTITGKTGEIATANGEAGNDANGEKKATIITSPKQNVVNVINAAKSLLGGDNSGHAIILTPGSKTPALVPLPDVKKQQIGTAVEKKAKALQMAKISDVLNAAMLSQLSPDVKANSEKVNTNLVAALRDMGSGPETTSQMVVKASVQKRSEMNNLKKHSRSKRSTLEEILPSLRKVLKIKRRKRRQMREKPLKIDNPSERSKLNKPIIPAPKLMDKIRDMSMVIATP